MRTIIGLGLGLGVLILGTWLLFVVLVYILMPLVGVLVGIVTA